MNGAQKSYTLARRGGVIRRLPLATRSVCRQTIREKTITWTSNVYEFQTNN